MHIFRNTIIIIILSASVLTSCAGPRAVSTNTVSGINNSPSNVVTGFLEATMNNDFGKAYSYIYFPGTDKEGYISRMQDLVAKSKNKIKSYRLISTRIIGDKSYVIYELELMLGQDGGSEQNLRYTRNQFELSVVDNKWKIVKDYGCIENCIN